MSKNKDDDEASLTLSEIENENIPVPLSLAVLKQSGANTSMMRLATPFNASVRPGSSSNKNFSAGAGKFSTSSKSSMWESLDAESVDDHQAATPHPLSRESSTVFRRLQPSKKRNKSIIQNQLMSLDLQNSIKDRRISKMNHIPRLSEVRSSSLVLKKGLNRRKSVEEEGALQQNSKSIRRQKSKQNKPVEEPEELKQAKQEDGTSLNDARVSKPKGILQFLDLRRKRKIEKVKTMRQNFEVAQTAATAEVHSRVTYLPRGGAHVMTSIGAVQFGMPPETIKDSLSEGLTMPVFYVVPKERFNLTVGVNVAELEFPTFYNYFIKQTRITLVTEESTRADVRAILQEALHGPTEDFLFVDREYEHCSEKIRLTKPDHVKELVHFSDYKPPGKSKVVTLTEDELIRYRFFDDKGYAYVYDKDNKDYVIIYDNREKFCFELFDYPAYKASLAKERSEQGATQNDDSEDPLQAFMMARGNGFQFCFQKISYDDAERCTFSAPEAAKMEAAYDSDVEDIETVPRARKKKFVIPDFGLTILGNSHGFDYQGTTTGFVIWVNGKGVMVDPPPHSSQFLISHGIPPKVITAIILTHCHADHDAGTFQKMITEHKVDLMTSATVFESFKRKYSAISNLTPAFIDQLVHFRPMFLEEPNYWNGAKFRFFYSLHAIPCVGFEVELNGKSIVYSADTMYSAKEFDKMLQQGVISKGRRERLMNFPWHCDIVLHESGVPPIHTTVESLLELPEEKRKNIHLVHIDQKSALAAQKKKLKVAKPGIENTIVLVPGSTKYTTTKLLQVISAMEIFEHIPVSKALELVLMAQQNEYEKGEVLVQEGEPHTKFLIIVAGTASVEFGELERSLFEGDYFGELMFVEDSTIDRNDYLIESVTAATKLYTLELDRYALRTLMIDDEVLLRKMQTIIDARIAGCWEAIESNEMLSTLSVSQKTVLQSLLVQHKFKRGETIFLEDGGERCEWSHGNPVNFAVLILNGELTFDEVHGVLSEDGIRSDTGEVSELPPLTCGMLVYDYRASVAESGRLKTTLRAHTDEVDLFTIDRKAFDKFLESNPLVLLGLFHSEVLP